ncbi:PIG-L family deacetylase [Mycobacterium manitobense]|uniref:PIG-L family deacetylase n=1 Tax=[Mycobacterium] manitobense TaxID=190147 RepID=A0A9X3BU98_9MYCO|nr:PIG-L family deacetylase [[Mycobacterium] manitobense]MCV7169231.1 PIG-L family deacetylase [[Mycobacterium] manitobense]
MMLIDSDLLDAQVVGVIARITASVDGLRVAVLADAGARGLRFALSAGIGEIIDPTDAESIAAFVSTTSSAAPMERVLAIGAHPDDVEIGCGATLLRHRDQGHWLSVLTLSRGAVGGPREDRRREAIGAAITMSAELLMGDITDTRI